MGELRQERMAELLREKIGGLIVEGKVKDPRVDPFLSVTRVDVSGNLAWADVYVSSFKTEGGLEMGVKGLQSAAGYIQSCLAKMLRCRKTPRLRFHVDTSIRDGFEVIQKMNEAD
jgi:ribosome-binding factor A